jgi:hypothetical protein
MEKSEPPTPERETICVPLAALLAMTSIPVRLPMAVGVNVTVIVQLAPPATLLPQLLVAPKSLVVVLIETMASVPLPLVVSVMVCGGLALPTF